MTITTLSVSIVTPAFNAATFIKRTIESVLSQDYPDIQHIVVDGGSTDGTLDVLKKYSHLEWTSEPDYGQSHALNKGFDSTKGEIIGWLNADDMYQPQALERAVDFLLQNPNVDFVYSDCIQLDQDDSFVRLIKGYPVKDSRDFLFRQPIPQPTIFFRKHVLQVLKGVDERLHYVMDWEFWLRASFQFQFAYLPGSPLAAFRKYRGSKSHSLPRKFHEEWVEVLSDLLQNPQGLSMSLIQRGLQYQKTQLYVADVLELAEEKKRLVAFDRWLKAVRHYYSFSMLKTFLYLLFVILVGGDKRIAHRNRKINVLYVQSGRGVGGAKVSLSYLLKALAPEKINGFLALSEPVDQLFSQMLGAEVASIKTMYLPFWFKSISNSFMSFLGKLRRGWYLLPVLYLIYLIYKNHIELVHSNSSATPVGAFAAFLTRRPHIWHVREPIGTGTEFPMTLSDSFSAGLMKLLSRDIICISEYTSKFFVCNGIQPKIILNGLNISEFDHAKERGFELKKRFGLDDKIVIGMVGSLYADWKEHDIFLQAMALIKHNIPNTRFLAFGGISNLKLTEYTRSLDKLIDSLDLTTHVIWAEHTDDIPAMMGSLDIFVHPVSKEGSGRVVMEAMAAGKPVVAVKAGGVPELITSDQTGVLVEPKNPSLLANAVLELIQNPKKMKVMGDMAKKYAQENFSHERTASAIFKIYERVLREDS